MRRIGELLVAEGLISEAAISRALGYQRVSGDKVKLGVAPSPEAEAAK